MRNLIHISIDKLDAEPSRMSMRWHHKGRINGGMQAYDRYYRENRAFNYLYHKIRMIIENSIGKNWNDIYSKIKGICKHIRYDFMVDHYIGGMIAIPVWSRRNQRWEYNSSWNGWGKNLDLLDHLDLLKHITSNHVEVFYYVCPVTNIIRVAKSKAWKKERHSDWWRRHYKFEQDRRKNKKKAPITEAMHKMINNRELYKFYVSIKEEYSGIMKVLKEGMKPIPTKMKNNLWDRYSARLHNDEYKKFSKNQMKLERLKHQIEDLEAGNFNTFFESAVYL